MTEDPWERRERERRQRRATSSHTPRDLSGEWVANQRAIGLLIGVCLLLAAEAYRLPQRVQLGLVLLGALALMLQAALFRDWTEPVRRLWRHGANPGVLLLLLWSAVSLFLAPFRGQAGAEMLRVIGSALAFGIAGYALRTPRERSFALGGLLGIGCLVALYDLAQFGQRGGIAANRHIEYEYSLIGTHENVGSLLVLLFPLAFVFALGEGIEEKRRLLAQAAALVLSCAWLLAQCRSAWIGGAVALLTVAILTLRYRLPRAEAPTKGGRRRAAQLLGSPLVILVAALVFLAGAGGAATLLSGRARSLIRPLEDSSLTSRMMMWKGAARMMAERPLEGWGLGTFTVLQGYWTHQGDDENKVLRFGTGHQNIAHNFYLQWGADTGGVGLALHVATVVAFLLVALRALPGVVDPVDRATLIGAIATAGGAAVDAIGSPAYHFHGVAAIQWAVFGLGVAATRSSRLEARAGTPSLWALSGGCGVLAAALAIGIGRQLEAAGAHRAPGRFTLLLTPATGPYLPGQHVTIRAEFVDERGTPHSTTPGTFWQLDGDPKTLSGELSLALRYRRSSPTLSRAELDLRLPNHSGAIVQVWARYRDESGRRYSDSVAVRTQTP